MKKVLGILLIIIMLFGFAACAGTCNGKEASTNGSSEGAKEINFYSSILLEDGSTELARQFTDETGIEVNVYAYDSADFVQAFMVAANGGSPIDVLLLNGQDVRYFMKNGLIQEIGDLPAVEKLSDAAIQQYTYNDKLYALGAKGGNSSGMFFNMNILDTYGKQPPTTMQEMFDLNTELKADGLSLIGFGGGNKYMWPMWYFSIFAQTSGGLPVERTEEILTGQSKFTDSDSLEAFQILRDFAENEIFQPGFNGTDSQGGMSVFVNNQAAGFYGGTWEITAFIEAGMDNTVLVPFPIVKDGAKLLQPGNASDGAFTIYKNIDPANQVAAEAFLNFATKDETILMYRNSHLQTLRDFGRVSCNKNVEPATTDSLSKTQQDFMSDMTFTHLDWTYPPEITTILQDTLQSLTGLQITAEEAAQRVQAVLDELLADGYDFNAIENPMS